MESLYCPHKEDVYIYIYTNYIYIYVYTFLFFLAGKGSLANGKYSNDKKTCFSSVTAPRTSPQLRIEILYPRVPEEEQRVPFLVLRGLLREPKPPQKGDKDLLWVLEFFRAFTALNPRTQRIRVTTIGLYKKRGSILVLVTHPQMKLIKSFSPNPESRLPMP